MKRILSISLIQLFAFAALSQDCQWALTGHIQDKDSKEELFGATVKLLELDEYVVTDENGDFRYSGLCPGQYTLEVSHAGCETIRREINFSRNMHLDILLPHLRNNLQEVVVEGRKPSPNTGFRQELSGKAMEETRGQSLAESLSKLNGVSMLQAGSTISKPVIHGLHSSRVLTINNGIRQEGQQWGNEHAPEIDTYLADKLTVIKGVDELKYGSDAIGGVVLVEPRPIQRLPGYRAELNTAFATNNGQYAVSGIFEQQLKKLPSFSYRLQGTFKNAGNVRTPNYRLNNTGMKERNFSLTADWRKEHYNVEAFYSEFGADIGLFTGSHVGSLTDLLKAIEADRPADVFLGERTYAIGRPRQEALHRLFKLSSGFIKNQHKFKATIGGQYNRRREYDILRNSESARPQVSLAIITLSEELSWERPKRNNLQGTVGLSFMQQDNSYSGRYLIPNYFSSTYGGYWIEKWSRHKLDIEAGLRFDHKSIATKRLRYGGAVADHDFNFSTWGSSLNVQYRFSPDIRINGSLTMANRAPHVNELLIDGIHEGAGVYERGDINLRPERSVNAGMGFHYSNKTRNFSVEAYGYYNRIKNFIYQQPMPDEPVYTIVGSFPLVAYRQTDALLKGLDLSLLYNPVKPVSLSSKLSLLRARNRNTNDWIILMPSDRWNNEVSYTLPLEGKISEASIGAGISSVFKPRVPGDKNGRQDYKPPPDPYTLFSLNAGFGFQVNRRPAIIGIGVKNVFNKVYREYMNSFRYYTDEMGRNITIRLKISFDKLY
ncbi:MAG TPA: TonB-dependent receptor [Flavitalea sp.]|nr:TonB-dependent receptor [Flavitalea sp.]